MGFRQKIQESKEIESQENVNFKRMRATASIERQSKSQERRESTSKSIRVTTSIERKIESLSFSRDG